MAIFVFVSVTVYVFAKLTLTEKNENTQLKFNEYNKIMNLDHVRYSKNIKKWNIKFASEKNSCALFNSEI